MKFSQHEAIIKFYKTFNTYKKKHGYTTYERHWLEARINDAYVSLTSQPNVNKDDVVDLYDSPFTLREVKLIRQHIMESNMLLPSFKRMVIRYTKGCRKQTKNMKVVIIGGHVLRIPGHVYDKLLKFCVDNHDEEIENYGGNFKKIYVKRFSKRIRETFNVYFSDVDIKFDKDFSIDDGEITLHENSIRLVMPTKWKTQPVYKVDVIDSDNYFIVKKIIKSSKYNKNITIHISEAWEVDTNELPVNIGPNTKTINIFIAATPTLAIAGYSKHDAINNLVGKIYSEL